MNLIPCSNLKEIILTEYELITDQIRLKSDIISILNKIELLLITVKYHIQKFALTGFGDISRPGQFELRDAGLFNVFRQSLLNSSPIHPPPHVVNTSTHREAAYRSIAYAAPRKRLILGTHKQCNTEYWRRWMRNSKIPLNYL